MLRKVLTPFLKNLQVLRRVCLMERFARCDLRSASMHLERASGSDDDGRVGFQTANAALDVAELLHTHVGAEPALGEDVPDAVGGVAVFGTGEFERDAVSEDGGVAVCDVGEGAGVDEDRCTLSKEPC